MLPEYRQGNTLPAAIEMHLFDDVGPCFGSCGRGAMLINMSFPQGVNTRNRTAMVANSVNRMIIFTIDMVLSLNLY
jgi:hypothetical protein